MNFGKIEYRMSFIWIFFIYLSSCTNNENLNYQISLVDRFIFSYNNQDFTTAASLFHIPPNYTEIEKQNEIKSISTSIKIIFDDFGIIKNLRQPIENELYTGIGIYSATSDYWAKYTKSKYIIFKVDYDDFGIGYIEFTFYEKNSNIQIRQLSFNVSLLNIESVAKLKETTNRLLKQYNEKNN
jgi:hypothetical protein